MANYNPKYYYYIKNTKPRKYETITRRLTNNQKNKKDFITAILFKNPLKPIFEDSNTTNIYKLLEKDFLVKKHIDENPENNNFYTYILSYKYISRNNADTFLHNVSNLFEWYITKNPDFKPLSELPKKIQMPEFATLLLTIAMNVMKVLIEKKFPKSRYIDKITKKSLNNKTSYRPNNRSANLLNKPIKLTRNSRNNDPDSIEYKKLLSVLTTINNEQLLNVDNPGNSNYFSYKRITEIYLKFIAYMSGFFDIENFDLDKITKEYTGTIQINCNFFIDYIKRIYKYTPFIIFPTFNQLDELTVLHTLSAPVINCLITYTRFLSHKNYFNPCYHIHHDIMFHGNTTHLLLYKVINNEIEFNVNRNNILLLFNEYIENNYNNDNTIDFFRDTYTNILSKYFNKKMLQQMEFKNLIKLFILFHETSYFSVILFNDKQLDYYDEIFENLDSYRLNVDSILSKYSSSIDELATKYEEMLQKQKQNKN